MVALVALGRSEADAEAASAMAVRQALSSPVAALTARVEGQRAGRGASALRQPRTRGTPGAHTTAVQAATSRGGVFDCILFGLARLGPGLPSCDLPGGTTVILYEPEFDPRCSRVKLLSSTPRVIPQRACKGFGAPTWPCGSSP